MIRPVVVVSAHVKTASTDTTLSSIPPGYSFIKFCHTLIDDSSKGFYESKELLSIRKSFYNPFNSIFHLGSKVNIFLCVSHSKQFNELESIIECTVDPRWSFSSLLGMHQASDPMEVPNSVFWRDPSEALFIDHRGLVR